MKTVAYYNGTIGTIDELTVPVKDRAVYFGDGIYDVAVAEQYHPFTLDDHINRFFCGIKLFAVIKIKIICQMFQVIFILICSVF